MRSIPILSKGTCINGRGRNGAFGEAGGFTSWHSRQDAHHLHTFSWTGQKKRVMRRFSVVVCPKCPAMGLQWAAWNSISQRLFGTNNCVVSSFVWASWVTRYNRPFIIAKLSVSVSSGRSRESSLHQLILSWSHLPIGIRHLSRHSYISSIQY